MPTRAKMTICGLYNYDDTLFDFMPIPTQGIDKDLMINSILVNCATLELVYPDHKLMKEMLLPMWANKNRYKWKTLFETTQFEYNPIYNVDADETETITRTRTGTDDNTRTLNTQTSDDNTRTLNTQTSDDNTRTLNTADSNTDTGKYAGFNSSSFKDVNNTVGSGTQTGTITDDRDISDTGTVKDERDISDTGTVKDERDISDTGTIKDNRETEETETITNTKRRQGNIGVTMTQQMIQAEREVAQFSIYDVIANDFKMEFCVMVY